MEMVSRAEPDGHTWLLSSTIAAINPALTKMSFDPLRDLAPVIQLGRLQVQAYARKDLPADTLDQLLALMRSRPGALACGTSGGLTRLAAEQLRLRADAALVVVDYKGAHLALNDLAAGHIDMAIGLTGSATGLLAGGRIRVIMADPSSGGPAATGAADLGLEGWYAVFAPAATPRTIVERMNAELNQVLLEPEVQKAMRDIELGAAGGSVEKMASVQRADTERFARLARQAGLRPE